ncbi:uncharacterized protein LOC119399064 [Rhipicephalus sanguineus]|uniref:uncharacterized protein LOC119399064 n=1 Tax=Rhipicephalus sanguineus TaxID=34632 RepID=UPI0020C3478A|nr:uncharacterized protein LOC119399064 [Rhipicephalus sanguineus]
MADENIYCGSWKITKCISLAAGTEVTEVEGTVFTLDESGDLSWTIPDRAVQMPFFSCETYEVFLGNPHYIRFFGTFAGHMIEFRVAHADEDGINLIYEGWCVLQCVKATYTGICSLARTLVFVPLLQLAQKEVGWDEPFSYLPALDEGYFSDTVITAEGGKEFPVHLTLLRLSCPAVEWAAGKPSPLDGLPEDVVAAALHCIYADCLPPALTEATARACVSLLSPPAAVGFERLIHLCELFLRNMAVKQRVMSLINDMHQCAATVAECFSAPSGNGGEGEGSEGSASPTASPARLCYVVGQALRECAVAAAKLLLLCGVFSRHKHLLSREERQDLIKHCVSSNANLLTEYTTPAFQRGIDALVQKQVIHYGILDMHLQWTSNDTVAQALTILKRVNDHVATTASTRTRQSLMAIGMALDESSTKRTYIVDLIKTIFTPHLFISMAHIPYGDADRPDCMMLPSSVHHYPANVTPTYGHTMNDSLALLQYLENEQVFTSMAVGVTMKGRLYRPRSDYHLFKSCTAPNGTQDFEPAEVARPLYIIAFALGEQ